MKKATTFFLFYLPFWAMSQNATLSGTIKDARNGEVLIGATISIPALKRGAITNEFGFFSLELPQNAVKRPVMDARAPDSRQSEEIRPVAGHVGSRRDFPS